MLTNLLISIAVANVRHLILQIVHTAQEHHRAQEDWECPFNGIFFGKRKLHLQHLFKFIAEMLYYLLQFIISEYSYETVYYHTLNIMLKAYYPGWFECS